MGTEPMRICEFEIRIPYGFVHVSLPYFRVQYFFQVYITGFYHGKSIPGFYPRSFLARSKSYELLVPIIIHSHDRAYVPDNRVKKVVYNPFLCQYSKEKLYEVRSYVRSGHYRKFQSERFVVEEFLYDSPIRFELYAFDDIGFVFLEIRFVYYPEHVFALLVRFCIEELMLVRYDPTVYDHGSEKIPDAFVLLFVYEPMVYFRKRFHFFLDKETMFAAG